MVVVTSAAYLTRICVLSAIPIGFDVSSQHFPASGQIPNPNSFGRKNMVGQLSPRPLLPAMGVGVIVAGNADPVFVDVVVTGSLKGDDHG